MADLRAAGGDRGDAVDARPARRDLMSSMPSSS